MKTVVYFVRHGEVHNPKDILYGRIPGFKLSKSAAKTVVKTANFLKNKKISFVYSSPLLRAKQTALIITKQLKLNKLLISSYLNEVRTILQGKSRSELMKINFDFYSEKYRGPNDETLKNIENRLKKFLRNVIKKHPGQNIVAVSHGDPLMTIKASILNLHLNLKTIRETEKDYISYAEVFKVTIFNYGEYQIERVFKPE